MNGNRPTAKHLPHRFYALDNAEYGRGALTNFGKQLKIRIFLFQRMLDQLRIGIPIDDLVTSKTMSDRIERCCLLFKNPERIVQALHDLRDLGGYLKKKEPVLIPLKDFTYSVVNLNFDLDHVFLVDYVVKFGRVIDISGFHSDYLDEVKTLGNSEFNRLTIKKMGPPFMRIEEVYLLLDDMRSCRKTLFPRHWDWRQCSKNALEALNGLLTEETDWGKSGELIVFGLSKKRMVIQLIIDVYRGKVITFFPNIKMTKKYHKENYGIYSA